VKCLIEIISFIVKLLNEIVFCTIITVPSKSTVMSHDLQIFNSFIRLVGGKHDSHILCLTLQHVHEKISLVGGIASGVGALSLFNPYDQRRG